MDDAAVWSAIAGWAAAAIAVVAAVLAGRQAKAAREQADAATDQAASAWRGANAAKESATEASKANKLAEQQLELERQRDELARHERDARDAEQARLIVSHLSNMGGLAVGVRNHSDRPVRDVRLDEVVPSEDPSWSWRPRATARGKHEIKTLDSHRASDFYIEMVRGDEVVRAVGHEYTITISFTDAQGVRWSRTGAEEPRRVTDLN